MIQRLIALVRLLLGCVCLVNGLNWFVKVITPYPSISDFIHFLPPNDIVGALIEQGVLFHLAKSVEIVTGMALLLNRMVPLALVLAMTVSVPVFIVDVFRPEFRLRAFVMGSGTLVMNVALLLAYLDHYRSVLAWRAAANVDPARSSPATGGALAELAGRLAKPLLLPLMGLSVLVGSLQVGWLLLLVGQHLRDPKAIHEVRALAPRPQAR